MFGDYQKKHEGTIFIRDRGESAAAVFILGLSLYPSGSQEVKKKADKKNHEK